MWTESNKLEMAANLMEFTALHESILQCQHSLDFHQAGGVRGAHAKVELARPDSAPPPLAGASRYRPWASASLSNFTKIFAARILLSVSAM